MVNDFYYDCMFLRSSKFKEYVVVLLMYSKNDTKKKEGEDSRSNFLFVRTLNLLYSVRLFTSTSTNQSDVGVCGVEEEVSSLDGLR